MKDKNLLIITQIVDKNDSILGFFHGWILEFAKQFKNVKVVCLKKGEYGFPENVEVFSLGKESGVSRLGYIINFYKYIFSKRKDYDTVFVHMNPIYVILGGIFWKVMNKKISLWYTHKNVDAKLRIAEKIVDTVFTASKESFRLKSKKIHIMGHGIDADKFRLSVKNEGYRNRLMQIGRISPIKKIDISINAMEIIVAKNSNYVLDIIGDVSSVSDKKYKEYLESMIEKKGLSANINFLGTISNDKLPDLFADYFCLLHTSETGSLDKVVLESMATGTFVLSCNDAIVPMLSDKRLSFGKGDFSQLADIFMSLSAMDEIEKNRLLNYYREIVLEGHLLGDLIVRIKEKI